MPVVAAVLHFSSDPALRADAVRRLAADPRVTPGEPVEGRLPVAVTTDSHREDDRFWRDLLAHGGVVHADIVFAALDDAAEASPEA